MILFVFLVTEDDCDDSTHQDSWQIKSQWYICFITIPAKLKLYFLKLLIQRKMSVTSALLVKSKKFQSTGVNSCICKGRCTEAVYDAGASTWERRFWKLQLVASTTELMRAAFCLLLVLGGYAEKDTN